MIDTDVEQVYRLSDCVRHVQHIFDGRVSYSSLYRWIHTGVTTDSGMIVKLESCLIGGGNTATSVEACRRFVKNVNVHTRAVPCKDAEQTQEKTTV